MITNIKDFEEVVNKHRSEFNAIPDEYLNDSGKAMQALYNQLWFDLPFAGSASDMLQLIRGSSEYDDTCNAAAIKELRMIERCLEKIGNL